MITSYYYGPLRGIILLAMLCGVGCIAAAGAFFIRHPEPTGDIFIAWVLVSMSIVLVVVVTAVWLYSYSFWRRAISMEEHYWEKNMYSIGG